MALAALRMLTISGFSACRDARIDLPVRVYAAAFVLAWGGYSPRAEMWPERPIHLTADCFNCTGAGCGQGIGLSIFDLGDGYTGREKTEGLVQLGASVAAAMEGLSHGEPSEALSDDE